MKIDVNTQSSIRLEYKGTVIYFDPYLIEKDVHDADYIFITHPHYDHYDESSILKVIKDDTNIIMPKSMESVVFDSIKNRKITYVKPNSEYEVNNLVFFAPRSYNLDKPFHPHENNWVGYVLYLVDDDHPIYIMGDTDVTPEACFARNFDTIFVPIGGTYTMDYKEAANYINEVTPKEVIPIHYGSIVGDHSLGRKFKELIDEDIICITYL